jgi:hypothetical protein
LTSKARLAVGDTSEREDAIFKMTEQKGTVPQICDRLSLGVQHSLYSLDDVVAMSQEEVEEFDVGLKLHLADHGGDATTPRSRVARGLGPEAFLLAPALSGVRGSRQAIPDCVRHEA